MLRRRKLQLNSLHLVCLYYLLLRCLWGSLWYISVSGAYLAYLDGLVGRSSSVFVQATVNLFFFSELVELTVLLILLASFFYTIFALYIVSPAVHLWRSQAHPKRLRHPVFVLFFFYLVFSWLESDIIKPPKLLLNATSSNAITNMDFVYSKELSCSEAIILSAENGCRKFNIFLENSQGLGR